MSAASWRNVINALWAWPLIAGLIAVWAVFGLMTWALGGIVYGVSAVALWALDRISDLREFT